VVQLEVTTTTAVPTIISDLRLDGDVLVIYDFHIDGPGAGSLGLKGVRQVIRAAMEAYGIESLEIHGYRRTTGAAPGRWPDVLRFTRR